MEHKKLETIFTAVVGRSGQNSLAEIFNKFCKNCFAEVEPPDLLYKSKGLLSGYINNFQRKFIVTHELLGRGKTKEWFEKKDFKNLDKVIEKKRKRIERLQKKYKFSTYIEISKFFMRTQYLSFHKIYPDLKLIKLTRDPIENAKSFINRSKDFYLDNVPPSYKQNCLQMDENKLTKFQLYLWSWCEIELRFQEFVKQNNINNYFCIKTNELNNKQRLLDLLNFFNLEYGEIQSLPHLNKNTDSGNRATKIEQSDIEQFLKFIEMVPPERLSTIEYLKDYNPQYFLK